MLVVSAIMPTTNPRPLLSLHMILKNEAASIERVLASARGVIDRWDILDTGSTDGTQDLVRKALNGIPGVLHEEPPIPFEDTGIIDFGATRNHALYLAARSNPFFTFWLSGDEYLVGGDDLRAFCEKMRDDTGHGAYPMTAHYDVLLTEQFRLIRCGTECSWKYPIHEWLEVANVGSHVPTGAYVLHTGSDGARKLDRFTRDLVVLERLRQRDKTDQRAAFYLAQTLECLGRFKDASQAYFDRVALGGWEEEVYEARYKAAWCADRAEMPWNVVKALYLDAAAFRPQRAEPYYDIALHYAKLDQHAAAYAFASIAAALPMTDTLFVQSDVYNHKALDLVATHAFYCGMKAQGEAAAKKLAELFPDDARHRSNLAFYSPSATARIGETTIKIRARTHDEQIVREIRDQDEYKLREMDLPAGATIVDVGCHIGIFATAALTRFPTASLVGIEMDDENYYLAANNLLYPFAGRYNLYHGAIAGDHKPEWYYQCVYNTGGHYVGDRESPKPMKSCSVNQSVTLRELLDLNDIQHVDLLKMDIEGAEYEVLKKAVVDNVLKSVDRIAMEYHTWKPEHDLDGLCILLVSTGFVLDVIRGNRQGIIIAKKPAAAARDSRLKRVAAAEMLAAL